MSIDRVVQPLVACLGNPVAGNPTQFVMSRIAREAGLDWRFFTSEVRADQFETAFRGVQALGLAGASVMEPFQASVVPMLDSISDQAAQIGRVSVVRSEGDVWIGDHTLGSAIMRLLHARLSGHSLREDGTMNPQSILVWGSQPTAQLIEGLLPSLGGDFALVHQSNGQRIDGLISPERPVRVLVLESPAVEQILSNPKQSSRWLQQVSWATTPVVICTQGRLRQGDGTLDWLDGRNAHISDEIELLTHQAAVDFHFWTGYESNTELIREALEEYLQW
jgi:shikimate dehydrogenase